MDIDLLFTSDGEAGLIASVNPVKKASGVVMDTQTGVLTLEFADMDYLDLNIPVDKGFFEKLEFCAEIHIGAVNGHIAQAYQIPFMVLDDPYRGAGSAVLNNSLLAFELFMRRCVTGQPVHREDLGDEEHMGCVLGEASPTALQFAPHLVRRRILESAPRPAPGFVPPTMGMGGGAGGGRTTAPSRTGKPKGKNDGSSRNN